MWHTLYSAVTVTKARVEIVMGNRNVNVKVVAMLHGTEHDSTSGLV
jgi:transcription antitermination factor NusA-like protein